MESEQVMLEEISETLKRLGDLQSGHACDGGSKTRKIQLRYLGRLNEIRLLWKKFISGLPVQDNGIISGTIRSSWERCKQMGVDPHLKSSPLILEESALRDLLNENEQLISTSLPFMENLATFFQNSDFIVSLFNGSSQESVGKKRF